MLMFWGWCQKIFDDLQEKTSRLNENSKRVGLKKSVKKMEVMRVCSEDVRKIVVDGFELKEVEQFTYLGSKISRTDGTEEDILARIQKARASFASSSQIWKSSLWWIDKIETIQYHSQVNAFVGV
jgi:hypothetical protein